jgi:hypothetical protein
MRAIRVPWYRHRSRHEQNYEADITRFTTALEVPSLPLSKLFHTRFIHISFEGNSQRKFEIIKG